MANIRVDVEYTIIDGSEVVFRSPVDCSAITGLKVYYPNSEGVTASKVFTLSDAHGNNVGEIDHLFAEDVVVKVILDVTKSMAFVQNADTNAYLEAQLATKAPSGYGLGATVGNLTTVGDANNAKLTGWYRINSETTNGIGATASMRVDAYTGNDQLQTAHSGSLSSDHFVVLQRSCHSGVWGDWAYINPPLVAGVAYRTAEYHDGKQVLIKLVDLQTLPASGEKTTLYSGSAATCVGLDVYVRTSSGAITRMPLYTTNGTLKCYATATKYNVSVYAVNDCSAHTGFAIVRYIRD